MNTQPTIALAKDAYINKVLTAMNPQNSVIACNCL
jgi:hypothetical protein